MQRLVTQRGYLVKDTRHVLVEESLKVPDTDVEYDLCANIEHLGNEKGGHYICA